jgi:hypothetical protein
MTQPQNHGLVTSFFPDTTHKLQTNSKSFMGPVKMYCSYEINQQSPCNNREMDPCHIREMGKQTWETASNEFIHGTSPPRQKQKYTYIQLNT